jgi:hypothetical protein
MATLLVSEVRPRHIFWKIFSKGLKELKVEIGWMEERGERECRLWTFKSSAYI